MAGRELSDVPDTTLPDPSELPYTPDEWDMGYQLWAIWSATGKRFLPSQLIHEIQGGYGKALNLVLDMESFYGKTKADMEQKKNAAQQRD